MPIVRVDMLAGRSLEQKRELARNLTRGMCEALGCPPAHVQVIIIETAQENWSTSGSLVADQVRS